MSTIALGRVAAWRSFVPRWFWAGLLMAALAGGTLLTATITRNWSIVPAGIFLGALTGPLAFCTWVTDRTRIGRSVSPDVLLLTFLVSAGVGTTFAGIFESRFFYQPTSWGWLWIAVVEETAKFLVPLAICTALPKYRSVEQALALAIVAAAGFAVMESAAYAISSLDQSVVAARDTLLERTLVTPFGHLPWTAIAVIVAARSWSGHQRIVLSPAALWGLGLAIALHTLWDLVLVHQDWWHLFVLAIGSVTFVVLCALIADVYYDGPYVVPGEHGERYRRRDHRTHA
jgi:RsiW-degrading membrane proteinase PrsW (M82 family)